MHNPNRDKFENFLKESIEQSSIDSWNDPGNALFDNALEIINNKKKKEKAILFIKITRIALLVLLSCTGLFFASKFLRISNDIEVLNKKVDQIESFNSVEIKSKSDKNVSTINEQSNISATPITGFSVDNNSEAKSNLGTAHQLIQPTESNINQIKNELPLSQFFSTGAVHTAEKTELELKDDIVVLKDDNGQIITDLSKKENHVLLRINSIRPLPNIKSEEIKKANPEEKIVVNMPINLKNNFGQIENKSLRASILLTNKFSSFKMKNITNVGSSSLTKYDNFYHSNGVLVGLEKDIFQRLSFGLDVEYSKVSNQSLFENSGELDMTNAIEEQNGDYKYSDELIVDTPLSTYKSGYTLEMESADMVPGNTINTTSENHICIDMISAQLGLKYLLIDRKKWSLFSNYNFGIQYVINAKGDMKADLKMDDKLLSDFNMEFDLLDELNSYFFSQTIGIGFDYKVNPDFQIRTIMNYSNSFDSIKKQQPGDNSSTSFSQLNIGVGIVKEFK